MKFLPEFIFWPFSCQYSKFRCLPVECLYWRILEEVEINENIFTKLLKVGLLPQHSCFYLLQWKAFKSDGKCFLLDVKSFFLFSRYLDFCLDFFCYVRKRLHPLIAENSTENHLTGFYMRATLEINGLIREPRLI